MIDVKSIFKKLLKEETTKQENYFKLWFLFEEGTFDEENSFIMKKIREKFFNKRTINPDGWKGNNGIEPKTILEWKKEQKKKHDGTYKRMWIWDRIEKTFVDINSVDSSFKSGKNFELMVYEDKKSQIIKKRKKKEEI